MPIVLHPARRRASGVPALLLFFTILLLSFSPGCFVGDFITVYFNTYYNALRLFSEAQDEVWALPETRLAGRNLLTPFLTPATTRTKLTQVIEKCSKLLQYYPDSRYVDDALLMIAKSFYYQADYQRSDRKCMELLDRFATSDLALDARLLLACARYREDNKESAQEVARALIEAATEQGEDGIVARASLVLAAVESDTKEFAQARKDYQRAADLADDADLRTGALLNVAEMYARLEDFEAAASANRRAADASKNYVGQFRGEIGEARMLAKQKKFDDALAKLRDLRSNANDREFFGEISLEIANVYRDMGDLEGAIMQYRLVDTAYGRTEASANSHFQLGLLYEYRLNLYDSARVEYNKGRGEWPAALVTQQLVRRADYLNRYSQFRGDLARYDSLRAALIKRLESGDSLEAKPDSLAARVPAVSDSLRHSVGATASVTPVMNLDSLDARRQGLMNELAALFYVSMDRPDSALFWYKRVLSEFPQGDYIPRVLYGMAQIYSNDTTSGVSSDSIYREIVQRFPETAYAAEARRILRLPPQERKGDPALTVFAQSKDLLEQGNGAAAIDTLKNLLIRYPSSPLASKAEYTMGWIYENVTQQPESAFVHYDHLVKSYPSTPFALRVMPRVYDPDVRARLLPGQAKKDTAAAGRVVAPPAQVPPPGQMQPPGRPDDDLQNPRKGRTPEEAPGADVKTGESTEKKPK